MAAGTVQVPPDSTGKILDTSELTVGANTVERENVVAADPTDASGLAKVKNAAPGAADYGLVTRNIPSGTQAVDGSGVTQPVSGTFFQATQPISATSLPLPTGAAVSASQTDGTQKAIARGGAKGATVAADFTGTAEGADHQALDVQVYHGGVAKDPTAIRALTSADVVTTAPPGNASTNVSQFAGTAASVNSGTKDAGTLRVVLATDQPALTNKLLVTPDSVALPANQSVNAAQLAGTATSVNSGTKDAGTLRVVLATDQPALTNKLLVTPDSVALPANQSVNVNQYGGTGVTLGQKAMTASEPVVIASDQAAIPISTIAGAITPGTAAANLGKAEDAAHVSSDTGVLALAVRVDVPNLPTAANTSANTDYTAPSADDHGVLWVRKRQLATYTANYRLAEAAAQLDLTFTFTANTNKQVATIYHGAGATKIVKIRKVSVFYTILTAAFVGVELRALSATTAPATGNPAITPRQHDPADGAAEATCLALPTTAGSVVGADNATVSAHVSIDAGATTASVSPATFGTTEVVLYEYKDGSEEKPLIMRAANAEGYAVIMRSTAATAQRFTVLIKFTEE